MDARPRLLYGSGLKSATGAYRGLTEAAALLGMGRGGRVLHIKNQVSDPIDYSTATPRDGVSLRLTLRNGRLLYGFTAL